MLGAWSSWAAAAPARADDIRDIRPLISIPPWWYFLAAALAATLILALIFAGIRYYRRRVRRPLTPEQIALLALDRAEAIARDGKCREWADLVAETLRGALAARLEREAFAETTSELASLDWSQVPRADVIDIPMLIELLSICDLTRFALGKLEPSALLAKTGAARAWISRLFAEPKRKEPVAEPNRAEPIAPAPFEANTIRATTPSAAEVNQ
jgi:hypothetical protein